MTAQASFHPRNGLVVPAPAPDTPEAVDAVVATAAAAAEPMAAVPPATRAGWLTAIAGEAMAGAGVTTGPFGIVHGFDAGTRLVSHPAVRAVGFTGSLAGGLALLRLAAARPEVIPVYAEMGTVNTVVVTPSAVAERPAEIAAGFVGSPAGGRGRSMTVSGNLAYDVLVNDPPPQDGLLPNGEPKRFSPQASTLIYGSEDAVLTDPGLTAGQARAVGDWVERKGRNLTETRQYLDNADELLSTENTATGFFNAKIERYPDHLGRMILWIGASVVYGVRDHPEEDIRKIILSSWL